MGRAPVQPRALFQLLVVFFSSFYRFSRATTIPAEYDGFEYSGGARVLRGAIIVEAFLDPICIDSKNSWPHLKRAVEFYAPHLSLIVHPFPLPYHDNAFVACRALHIANLINASTTFPLLELFFEHQKRWYNGPTNDMSKASIVDDIAKHAVIAIGNSSLSAFLSGFEKSESDMAARTSFKYGCSRGVGGAPYFFVNGFLLPGAGSPVDFGTWKSIIDPLLKKQKQLDRREEPLLHLEE